MKTQIRRFAWMPLSLLWLLALLAACQPIRPVSDGGRANPMTNSAVTITVDEAGIQAPDELPNGLVKLVLQNSGQALRAIFINRLAADETVQESLQFLPGAPGSKSTLIGAAFLHPGARYESVLQLPTGNYYAVDIMATTPVVDEFVVGESTHDSTTAPTAAVQVTAQEFAFVMPDAIAAGASWWQIENQGKQPHDLTLYKLENGMTLDKLMETLIATEVGRPEPLSFPSVAHWVMGAGQTNWVNFDLAAGEYVVVSMTPDLSTMPPDATQADFTKGMVHALTVK
jgi:hypothetical protein